MHRHWFSQFGRQGRSAKSRPVLLLWLVPMLALGLFASGPHDHDIAARHVDPQHSALPVSNVEATSVADASTTSTATGDVAQTPQHEAPSSAAHATCLSCQWSSAANAYQAAPALLPDEVTADKPVAPSGHVVSCRYPRSIPSRGPPLS